MLQNMQLVMIFITSMFSKHILHVTLDPCEIHYDIELSLSPKNNTIFPVKICNCYQFPFKFFNDLRSKVSTDLVSVVDDCKDKVKLFMAHVIRVINQKESYKNYH